METTQNQAYKGWKSYKSTILGIMLILFGSFYFAYQADLIDREVWNVIFSWQMLLIALGILTLSERNYAWGITLIVIGALFLNGYIVGYIWPVMIILAGLAIIFLGTGNKIRRNWAYAQFKHGSVTGDYLNETAIFGGNERYVNSDNFQGGSVVSVFGGSKLDLTNCNIQPGQLVELEITSILGGSTLIIPNDWNVQLQITSILGGFSDKRVNTRIDKSKTVVIKGVSILGGGELK